MNQEIGNPDLPPEASRAVRKYLEIMVGGFKSCPQCDLAVDERQQIGCCVYAFPCGHRLYHGTLPKGDKHE